MIQKIYRKLMIEKYGEYKADIIITLKRLNKYDIVAQEVIQEWVQNTEGKLVTKNKVIKEYPFEIINEVVNRCFKIRSEHWEVDYGKSK